MGNTRLSQEYRLDVYLAERVRKIYNLMRKQYEKEGKNELPK